MQCSGTCTAVEKRSTSRLSRTALGRTKLRRTGRGREGDRRDRPPRAPFSFWFPWSHSRNAIFYVRRSNSRYARPSLAEKNAPISIAIYIASCPGGPAPRAVTVCTCVSVTAVHRGTCGCVVGVCTTLTAAVWSPGKDFMLSCRLTKKGVNLVFQL